MTIEQKLDSLGLGLPDAPAPAANYVPFVISGNHVYISGQISRGQKDITGKVGETLSVEEGQEAARICALNILAQLKEAVNGDWMKVRRCVRLGGFVNCTPDFTDQPLVINGASNLIAEIMGDAGKHARAAVGVSSLPLGVAVEIDAIFEIEA